MEQDFYTDGLGYDDPYDQAPEYLGWPEYDEEIAIGLDDSQFGQYIEDIIRQHEEAQKGSKPKRKSKAELRRMEGVTSYALREDPTLTAADVKAEPTDMVDSGESGETEGSFETNENDPSLDSPSLSKSSARAYMLTINNPLSREHAAPWIEAILWAQSHGFDVDTHARPKLEDGRDNPDYDPDKVREFVEWVVDHYVARDWRKKTDPNAQIDPDSIGVRAVAEIGDENTFHLHILIMRKSPVPFKQMRKRYPFAHISRIRGTAKQAIDYIYKRGTEKNRMKAYTQVCKPVSYGNVVVGNARTKEDIMRDCEEEVRKGTSLDEIFAYGGMETTAMKTSLEQFYNSYHNARVPDWRPSLSGSADGTSFSCSFWHIGDSGSGKSRLAQMFGGKGQIYTAQRSKYPFDKFSYQKGLLFDDLKPFGRNMHSEAWTPENFLAYLYGQYDELPNRYAGKVASWEHVHVSTIYPMMIFWLYFVGMENFVYEQPWQLARRIGYICYHWHNDSEELSDPGSYYCVTVPTRELVVGADRESGKKGVFHDKYLAYFLPKGVGRHYLDVVKKYLPSEQDMELYHLDHNAYPTAKDYASAGALYGVYPVEQPYLENPPAKTLYDDPSYLAHLDEPEHHMYNPLFKSEYTPKTLVEKLTYDYAEVDEYDPDDDICLQYFLKKVKRGLEPQVTGKAAETERGEPEQKEPEPMPSVQHRQQTRKELMALVRDEDVDFYMAGHGDYADFTDRVPEGFQPNRPRPERAQTYMSCLVAKARVHGNEKKQTTG